MLPNIRGSAAGSIVLILGCTYQRVRSVVDERLHDEYLEEGPLSEVFLLQYAPSDTDKYGEMEPEERDFYRISHSECPQHGMICVLRRVLELNTGADIHICFVV